MHTYHYVNRLIVSSIHVYTFGHFSTSWSVTYFSDMLIQLSIDFWTLVHSSFLVPIDLERMFSSQLLIKHWQNAQAYSSRAFCVEIKPGSQWHILQDKLGRGRVMTGTAQNSESKNWWLHANHCLSWIPPLINLVREKTHPNSDWNGSLWPAGTRRP